MPTPTHTEPIITCTPLTPLNGGDKTFGKEAKHGKKVCWCKC